MVSSTFYDLRQVRDVLRRWIEHDLGYTALLSEHSSFPIDPDLTTIENCRQRVENDADVLVLVIGSRYGSLDDKAAKSITNLEYLAARHKNIPIYAFVDQGVLPLIPVWKANPAADFSQQVDTPKLFEFVDTVRRVDHVWMQEFKTAHEIIDALRIQFAYQHERGLRLLRRLRSVSGSAWVEDLRGNTLRIALERPAFWEYRLFMAALIDAVNRHYRDREAHRHDVALGLGEDVEKPIEWIRRRLSDALRLLAAANTLVNTSLPIALGPPGTPADPEMITSIAASLGQIYGDALKWQNRVTTANLDERFHRVTSLVGGMLNDVIEEIEKFGPRSQHAIEAALADTLTGKTRHLTMTLTFKIPTDISEEIDAELRRLKRAL